jgi:hypothetical protein
VAQPATVARTLPWPMYQVAWISLIAASLLAVLGWWLRRTYIR